MWRRGIAAAALLCAAFGASPTSADDVGLSKIETKDGRVLYYDPIQTYLVPYVGRSLENSLQFQERMFGWKPWDKTTVYLRDLSDVGRAMVRTTPNNALTIDVAPPPTLFETFSPGERFFTLMNHELVHVATMDVWNSRDGWWRNFFHGKPLPVAAHPETILYSFLAQPRAMVPRWYLEGSAVFMETWMGGGIGRAQGGYDEMVFRAMVRDNARFFDPLGLESEGNNVDFQIGVNDYLYGTRFMSYLAYTYGPEKVIQWLRRDEDSKAYYEAQFEYVFGKPLDDAWADWIAFEHNYQRGNLASVQQYPTTPTQRLTPVGLGSVSRAYFDPRTNSLIAGFRAPGVIANVGVISLKDGSVRRLTNIKGPALYRVTALVYDPDTDLAYYTEDNNAYRDLKQVNVTTGETKMLMRDIRVGDLALDRADKSLWGIRHLNGVDAIVRIGPERRFANLVVSFDYGHVLSDLDVSPDGSLLAVSIAEINGAQRIGLYRTADLLAGNIHELTSLQLGQSGPEGGTFSPDGKYLYATAYYTGISNVYRWNIAANTWEAVSNAVTGFFRPIPLADGSLIVFEYSGQGFTPVKIDPKPLNDLGNVKFLGTAIADKYPVVKTWTVGSPAKIPLDDLITGKGVYDPRAEMAFDADYPILAGYKGHIAAGWHFQMEDPLMFNQLLVNVSYSPANNIRPGEQFHADVSYSNLFWKLQYWHNNADFYDLFGPTDNSRKGDALIASYHEVKIYDPPRQLDFLAEAGYYSGLDTLPGAQNVSSGASSLGTLKLALNYTNIEQSIGSIDNEAGVKANAAIKVDYQRGTFFPKFRAGYDFGVALPWAHSSAWLYSSAGIGGGDPSSPLDSFYFGAFGNNFVDDGDIKRYREYETFPGFGIDAIDARSFVKTMGEFNFPPVRFAHVGWPAWYMSSLRTAVFAGALFADPGMTSSRTLGDVGIQVDLNFSVAVRLPMTLSFGYAHGFGPAPGRHDELMVSLKIL